MIRASKHMINNWDANDKGVRGCPARVHKR
jgi:hypothetical protein